MEKQVPIRLLREAQSLRAGSHRRFATVRSDSEFGWLVHELVLG